MLLIPLCLPCLASVTATVHAACVSMGRAVSSEGLYIRQSKRTNGFGSAVACLVCCCRHVNQERTVIQELQITPMGVITMIHPKNNDTDTRIWHQPVHAGGKRCTVLQQLQCAPRTCWCCSFDTVSVHDALLVLLAERD
jgi:hypothetical protein